MKPITSAIQLPLLSQARDYRPAWLKYDLSAGLSVAAVSLPSAIAYPAIAGLPLETGLFAAIFSMLGYALVGPSRQLMVGPDTATCIMLAGILGAFALPDADARATLAQMLAVMVGFLCLAAGWLRLGVLANFLSRPMLVGFLIGISISLIIGQITRLTAVPIEAGGILRPLAEFARHVDLVHWGTLTVGIGSLVAVRLLQRCLPGMPALLMVIAGAIGVSAIADLPRYDVDVIGTLPPIAFHLTWPGIDLAQAADLLGGAIAIMVVSFGSGIVTARSFAMKARSDVSADRELIGFGGANIASGLFGGFPVTASDSRTAVNFAIGGRSQLTALIAAAGVAVAVLFIADLLAYLPTATLGAVLISAAIDLIDLKELRAIRRIDPTEFGFSLITMLGVAVVGVLQGVFIAIAVTLLQLLWTASHPRTALLGFLPGRPGLVKLHRYPEAEPVPGMVIVMIQSAVVFFNADYLKHRLLKIALARRATTKWVVLDASAVNLLDSTAVAKLEDLRAELAAAGMLMCLCELNSNARKCVQRSGLAERLGVGMVFTSTEAAVIELTGRTDSCNASGTPKIK
ncbi:SulP family inorganic anion transporter [Dongia sp.]|uniref:SulP family inorganic anion transporter n=1 Tax=Dongia sp. TaxID=1977262 RepID=UPI0035B3FAB7